MDATRLALLRDFADLGGVRRVAERNHLTASAVSQQLRRLEREAGVDLFEQHGRGLRLTPAGNALATAAIQVGESLAAARAALQPYTTGTAGIVTISLFGSGAELLLPHTLDQLATTAPNLRLEPALEAGSDTTFAELTSSYDIVVAHTSHPTPHWAKDGIRTTPLLTEPLDIAVPTSSDLADQDHITIAQVAQHPWIGVPPDMPFDAVFRTIQTLANQPITVATRFPDLGTIEALIAHGHGIGLVSRHTTHHPGITLIPLPELNPTRNIVALTRTDTHQDPRIHHVLHTLQHAAHTTRHT